MLQSHGSDIWKLPVLKKWQRVKYLDNLFHNENPNTLSSTLIRKTLSSLKHFKLCARVDSK